MSLFELREQGQQPMIVGGITRDSAQRIEREAHDAGHYEEHLVPLEIPQVGNIATKQVVDRPSLPDTKD